MCPFHLLIAGERQGFSCSFADAEDLLLRESNAVRCGCWHLGAASVYGCGGKLSCDSVAACLLFFERAVTSSGGAQKETKSSFPSNFNFHICTRVYDDVIGECCGKIPYWRDIAFLSLIGGIYASVCDQMP